MRNPCLPVALVALALGPLAAAVPSLVETVRDGVCVVRDDADAWGGHLSLDITHQSQAEYQARKVLDLTDVPADFWERVRDVRLSACFLVRDYSWHDRPPANGLDEAFEVVVNGTGHRYPTNCGAPQFREGQGQAMDWYDLPLPKAELRRGPNEILLRKAPSDKNDDYLYLAIDRSQRRGNSAVSFDGTTWTQDKLTIPGGNGEYMVRLYLLTTDLGLHAEWRPGQEPALADPAGVIAYAGARDGRATAAGLPLGPAESARLEWAPTALDRLQPVTVTVRATAEVEVAWLNETGSPVEPQPGTGEIVRTLPAGRTWAPSGLQVTARAAPAILESAQLAASASYRPQPVPIDLCPAMAAPKGQPVARPPACRRQADGIELENAGLRCRFVAADHLQLTSLYNEFTASEMLRSPQAVSLFVVEVDGRRYAGSRDFRCAGVKPLADGFEADLRLDRPALQATLTARIEAEGLRLGLNLTNAGPTPVGFKLAFPHLAGLAASATPAADYYFFPWGGGIVADTPATIRRGYGDHEALYQVMDVFSPERGGGLSVRADDADGWHKGLALRKHVPGQAEKDVQQTFVHTTDEYRWTNPLDAVEGVGFAYEYLRRTRPPDGTFAPADAVLSAHAGDWHVAMRTYADWAHRVWTFRPRASRLRSVRQMLAVGWAGDTLFRNGRYRDDFIRPGNDCVELMSWWDWSPLGPWSTPFDKLDTVLNAAQIKEWGPYFVKDPVTGQTMWNDQPGDYAGYNERFGGLPAFRAAVASYRRTGALVTLYTDPFRLDDNCPTGRQHGREWTVIGTDGKPTASYECWNPCHDLPEVRQWVVDTMKRVMIETGADGLRLDEYGHTGWVCFSDQHRHTYAERGVSQWQKAVADTARRVHAALDEVRPGLVLTTEHPGYDYLMPALDGCITYDYTVQTCPLRPLECNLQRFFFPECKAYELDHRGADPRDRKKFWNAVASFGRRYPDAMYAVLAENEAVYQDGAAEPLVPAARARYVYVNRFTAPGKALYHVYNASGHTVDGPLLAVPLAAGEHAVDLLAARECAVRGQGREAVVELYLPRDEVACVACLPRRLEVRREGQAVQVTVTSPGAVADGLRLVLADREGHELASTRAVRGTSPLGLTPRPGAGSPACVKLLAGPELLDLAELPRP